MGPLVKKKQGSLDSAKAVFVPCSLLKNRKISVLEAISKYLKEERQLTYHEIGVLLHRNERTIWTCYSRAHKKQQERYVAGKAAYTIPVSIFHDRSVSVLEAISEYMKDSLGLTYHEIAVELERDDRTIWTCYQRAKAKRKHGKK